MLPTFELYMPDSLEEACRLKAAGAEVVAGCAACPGERSITNI